MTDDSDDDDIQHRLDEIHETVRERGLDGDALKLTGGRHDSFVYWDDEAGAWLFAAWVEGGHNRFPTDDFPKGMELPFAWGDFEWVDVEETPLHHATYGLDQSREGYGPVVGGPE